MSECVLQLPTIVNSIHCSFLKPIIILNYTCRFQRCLHPWRDREQIIRQGEGKTNSTFQLKLLSFLPLTCLFAHRCLRIRCPWQLAESTMCLYQLFKLCKNLNQSCVVWKGVNVNLGLKVSFNFSSREVCIKSSGFVGVYLNMTCN